MRLAKPPCDSLRLYFEPPPAKGDKRLPRFVRVMPDKRLTWTSIKRQRRERIRREVDPVDGKVNTGRHKPPYPYRDRARRERLRHWSAPPSHMRDNIAIVGVGAVTVQLPVAGTHVYLHVAGNAPALRPYLQHGVAEIRTGAWIPLAWVQNPHLAAASRDETGGTKRRVIPYRLDMAL